MTAEVIDEQFMGFLADSAHRTLQLSTAVARRTEARGLRHAVAGRPQDDAAILLLEWNPPAPES
ncbi:hypothetical protein [Streptomyces sp. NBC_01334]|uniref:hypothetical protein n=1 Tax=Streptomyces sp. NBC_01334 TaxID=2903827 RepID=UPI002E0D417D|nr:hypothetical protein OG736_40750 [Streptomyces sp. NBC_01334]